MTQKNTVPQWVNDAIIYQIFPDRFANGDPSNDPIDVVPWGSRPTRTNFFGGDLKGIIDHVDYLKALGVNCLYLTPIFEAPSNHRYDTKDYFQVDKMLGTTDTLKALTQALHNREMRIILDGVFAHVSDEFPAFKDVLERGAASPYAQWFLIDSYPIRKHPKPSYRACGGLASMPRLNVANAEVHELLCKVGEYWIETADIDGWRLDMAWEVPHEAWSKFSARVRDVKADAFLLGEFWGDATPWLGRDKLDSSTNYLWRDAVFRFFVNQCTDAQTFVREIQALRELYGPHGPTMVNLLGSHDTPRLMTICRQNSAKAIQALAILLTDIGVPLIYYGDEVGLTGGNDPGCRKSMPWGSDTWNRKVYEASRVLINLRRRHPALRRGDLEVILAEGRILAFVRQYEGDTVLAAFNAGFQWENFSIKLPETLNACGEVWRSSPEISLDEVSGRRAEFRVKLPPQGVLIMASRWRGPCWKRV